METKIYVSEVKESEKCSVSLDVLNAYKVALLKDSKDPALLEAAKALEVAKTAYQKAVNKVVLGDDTYNKLQTECVRTAVSEFSHKHNLVTFAAWFNDNGKDTQTGIIDTAQKLGSHVKALHDSFAKGKKTARKKAESISDLQAQADAIIAKLKALKGE